MTDLLSGNEAIARGAFEAGVKVAAAYPGTPSTEILENLATYPGVYAEWSPNEKVALEVAIGACYVGVRSLAAMKHVGLNVASDPFMTLSYTGVNGGLVVVSADDPELHSSQNEQDNRHLARMARIPILEPSDSAEAKAFTKTAFTVSERFDTPVMLRTTTRISHSKSPVPLSRPSQKTPKAELSWDEAKYVMVPAHARVRHWKVLERYRALKAFTEQTPLNRLEKGDTKLGFVASGVAYQYVREVFPDATVLKLGMPYPLPEKLIRKIAGMVKRLVVVEELDPFLEDQIKALGIKVEGKNLLPLAGELSPSILRRAFFPRTRRPVPETGLPIRPPALCPGCPHMALFSVVKKEKVFVCGDIGCYTLAVNPPLKTMQTTLCMGAGISQAHGMAKALPHGGKNRVVAVIGDSTFFHSGLPAVLNLAYNKSRVTVFILDNRTTAMTGRQEHPGSGRTLQKESTIDLELEKLVRSLGIPTVVIADPYRLEETKVGIEKALNADGPSVVISRAPCLLLSKKRLGPVFSIDPDLCTGCKKCLAIGCAAISFVGRGKEGRAVIAPALCAGCGICIQSCSFGAIGTTENK